MLTADRLKELLTYDPDTGIFRWNVFKRGVRAGSVAGWMRRDGRICIMVDGSQYYAARLAYLYMTGRMPPREIDHRDCDKSNNQWTNLRPATRPENGCNVVRRRRRSSSGFKNVYAIPGGWRVQVAGARTKNFKCLGLALKHRNELLQHMHGEFARLDYSQRRSSDMEPQLITGKNAVPNLT